MILDLLSQMTRLWVGLDYGEKVDKSSICRQWSNMIGYETGSSPARVYTMARPIDGEL
jgi:hypothetical protein